MYIVITGMATVHKNVKHYKPINHRNNKSVYIYCKQCGESVSKQSHVFILK